MKYLNKYAKYLIQCIPIIGVYFTVTMKQKYVSDVFISLAFIMYHSFCATLLLRFLLP